MIVLFGYSLSFSELSILICVGVLVGMAKTGISGAGMIAVPLLALAFGGKNSSGLMLPFLIIADVCAIAYYHKHANWHYLRKLPAFAIIGVVIGTLVGNQINDELFKTMMAVMIFFCLSIMLLQEKSRNTKLPDSTFFTAGIGVFGGFTTMVGNLAGPVMSLYLLAMRLPKNEFIGTAAWFFLLINLFKVPFHVYAWHTININSVLLNLSFFPAVALGALLGIKIIKLLPEKLFRYFVIAMTAVAAIALLL